MLVSSNNLKEYTEEYSFNVFISQRNTVSMFSFSLDEGYVLGHQRRIVIHHEVYLLISSIAPFGFV